MSSNHHLEASKISAMQWLLSSRKSYNPSDTIKIKTWNRMAMEITLKITRVPLSGPWTTLPS